MEPVPAPAKTPCSTSEVYRGKMTHASWSKKCAWPKAVAKQYESRRSLGAFAAQNREINFFCDLQIQPPGTGVILASLQRQWLVRWRSLGGDASIRRADAPTCHSFAVFSVRCSVNLENRTLKTEHRSNHCPS